jgi:predicted transcriptional regulator
MAIGDVQPQEQQDKDQPSSSTLVQPQLKMRNRYLKTEAWVKGEHMKKRIKRKKYNVHLQLKSGPPFKETIQWIRFWVTSARE